jgi:hypothetical protein
MKNKISTTILTILVAIMITSCGANPIKVAKNSSLEAFPDRTMEGFCKSYQYITDGKWTTEKTESGRTYVYFKAKLSDVGLYGEDYMQLIKQRYNDQIAEYILGQAIIDRDNKNELSKEIVKGYENGVIAAADYSEKILKKYLYDDYESYKDNQSYGGLDSFEEYPKWLDNFYTNIFNNYPLGNDYTWIEDAMYENKSYDEVLEMAQNTLALAKKNNVDMTAVSEERLSNKISYFENGDGVAAYYAYKLINKYKYDEYLEYKGEIEESILRNTVDYPNWLRLNASLLEEQYIGSDFKWIEDFLRERKTYDAFVEPAKKTLQIAEKYKVDPTSLSDNELIIKFHVDAKKNFTELESCYTISRAKFRGFAQRVELHEVEQQAISEYNLMAVINNKPLDKLDI